jgi:hypothetical protein
MNDRLNNHRTHADLLSQVADSTAERDAVRRILSEPLDEHELDTLARYRNADGHPTRFAACADGPCAGGRKLCPTPEACRIADQANPPRPPMRRGDALRLIALGLAAWAAVAATLYAMGVRP